MPKTSSICSSVSWNSDLWQTDTDTGHWRLALRHAVKIWLLEKATG